MRDNIKIVVSMIWLVCIVLFMSGCSQNKRYDVLMHQPDSIMNKDDDSVYYKEIAQEAELKAVQRMRVIYLMSLGITILLLVLYIRQVLNRSARF